jgi:hypothetical protein
LHWHEYEYDKRAMTRDDIDSERIGRAVNTSIAA